MASADGTALIINYKLNKGYIKANDYCFKNTFLLVNNITSNLILGTPFLTHLYPFYEDLHTKIMGKTISFKFLSTTKYRKISSLQSSSTTTIHLKQHIITLPYEKDFNERQIPTKARTSNTNEC